MGRWGRGRLGRKSTALERDEHKANLHPSSFFHWSSGSLSCFDVKIELIRNNRTRKPASCRGGWCITYNPRRPLDRERPNAGAGAPGRGLGPPLAPRQEPAQRRGECACLRGGEGLF